MVRERVKELFETQSAKIFHYIYLADQLLRRLLYGLMMNRCVLFVFRCMFAYICDYHEIMNTVVILINIYEYKRSFRVNKKYE